MAFVDDYTALVIGKSAANNTRIIEEELLPTLESWERESGAVFEALKTAFVHFTRNRGLGRDDDTPLRFKEDLIQPSGAVKLLGAVLDQELRFKLHVSKAAKRAYLAALALKRLRGLRPSSVR